jgi:diphosphomevalonate decarboxylase
MKSVCVSAHANLALLKYWGKRDQNLFLPTKSSLSVSLDALSSYTKISFSNEKQDVVLFEDFYVSDKPSWGVIKFLDLFRKLYNINQHFNIFAKNNFPTAAGLASSSSGFAALAVGLSELCGLKLSKPELSILARQGSGSACRSVYGGFVVWHKGRRLDGSDCYAEQIFSASHWPELRVVIAVIDSKSKKVSSRDGMRMLKFDDGYEKWTMQAEESLPIFIECIRKKDLKALGNLVQDEWQQMHDVMINSKPSLDYWKKTSFEVIDAVKRMRADGLGCCFTTDAGPNVKVLCLGDDVEKIQCSLSKFSGVQRLIVSEIAQNPYLVESLEEAV